MKIDRQQVLVSLIIALIPMAILFWYFWITNTPIIEKRPDQEMRCDYDWCVIVDKAQPIPVIRQSNLTWYNQ